MQNKYKRINIEGILSLTAQKSEMFAGKDKDKYSKWASQTIE